MGVTYGGFQITHGQTLGTVTMGDFFMQITNLDWDGIERAVIECTNMNVQPTTAAGAFGNKIFIPSAYVDPGEVQLEILHDPTQVIPITDPTDDGPVDIVIKLGPSTSQQETFDAIGFLTKYKIKGPMDGSACKADVTLKLTDIDSYDQLGAVQTTTAA